MTPEGPDPRAEKGTRLYWRALIALTLAAVATFAQVYSPQGLLPDIARDFGISASASSLALGATTIGLAIGVLPWGRLSDRIGRVRAMRWAIVASVLVGLASPFAPSFGSLVGVRFVEGLLLAGLPAIGVTALAETVTPLAFGSAVGVFIAGNTIGGLFGRVLSTVAGEPLGWRWGMFLVALLAAVAAVLFLVLMPPTVLPPGPSLPLFQATIANLRNPGVMVMVAQGLLLMGGFVAAYNYLSFRLQHPPFGLTPAQVAPMFLAYLAGALASSWVWSLTRRIAPISTLILSIATMLAGLGITLLPWLLAIALGLVVFTIGFFGAHAIALGLASRRADSTSRSLAPSLYNAAYYTGSTLLGWVGGVAYAAAAWGGTAAMIAAAAVLAVALAWGHAARNGGARAVDAA